MNNNDIIANAILMTQGFCIPIESDASALSTIDMFSQICQIDIDSKEIFRKMRDISDKKISIITANNVNDDIHITFVLEDDICNKNGVFSYVYNVSCPLFSEFGYTFFSNDNGVVKRIG
jgi:hypothetical protein